MSISCSAAVMLMELYTCLKYILCSTIRLTYVYCERKREFLVGETEMRKETKKISENKNKSIREIRIDRSEKYIYIHNKKKRENKKKGGQWNKK